MAEIGDNGTLIAKCRRCGGGIEIEPQMVTNMVALGEPLVFEHAEGSCPGETRPGGEPAPTRRFRLQVLAYEIVTDDTDADIAFAQEVPGCELLAGIGHTAEGRTLAEAMNGPLQSWLTERRVASGGRFVSGWERFLEQTAWADAHAPTPRA